MNQLSRVERIEERLDKAVVAAVPISSDIGGIKFGSMVEVMEFSKLMSLAGAAVPPHLQGEPGACLAVCVQALEWRFSPFAVANKSYLVNGRIAYESQLIHAVIEARAPLIQRLRCAYEGDGGERVCVVSGHLRGETEPVEYRSPRIAAITPKNSPLWKTDPDQQLWYYASRAWARRFCPDILLGVFTRDELEDSNIGPERAKDVTPKPSIADRLPGKATKGKGGFSKDHVEAETAAKPASEPVEPQEASAAPSAPPEPATAAAPQPAPQDTPNAAAPSPAAKARGSAAAKERPADPSSSAAGLSQPSIQKAWEMHRRLSKAVDANEAEEIGKEFAVGATEPGLMSLLKDVKAIHVNRLFGDYGLPEAEKRAEHRLNAASGHGDLLGGGQ